jgi:hypothetical protein
MRIRLLFILVLQCFFLSSCERKSLPLSVSDDRVDGPARLVLTADTTNGTVPLTVNFTGTLYGRIDTIFLRVPEVSFVGGYDPADEIYVPLLDTLTVARRVYTAREHYFVQHTFKAVMKLHGMYRDIVSDTVVITVQ